MEETATSESVLNDQGTWRRGRIFFFRKGVKYEEMKHIATNLECTGFHKDDFGLIIATIFRPENAF